MRILHLCAALPRNGGGMSELIPSFVREQTKQGHQVTLVFTRAGEKMNEFVGPGATIRSFRRSFPGFLFFSWGLFFHLPGLIRRADMAHVHSNWTFPVWYGCFCALILRKELVMSPHGCLDPVRLRHSRWKKKLVGGLDLFFLRRADAVHVLSETEATWCTSFAGRIRSFASVPYGVNLAGEASCARSLNPRTVVYLGRLHPLKGLDLLIEVWKQVFPAESAGWRLVIAGPDEQGCLEELQGLAENRNDIVFKGPVYSDAKWELLKQASVFVLPTRSENFGIAVGEALACGTPVIVTKAAPWEGVETYRCGYWCEVDVGSLSDALERMMKLSDAEREEMGQCGRAWVRREFSWESAAKRMVEVYEKTLSAKDTNCTK